MELKLHRSKASPLTRTMTVAYEHNRVYVNLILKLLRISETVTCQFIYLNFQNLNFKIYSIANEIHLKLQSAKTVLTAFKKKESNGHSWVRITYYHSHKLFNAMLLRHMTIRTSLRVMIIAYSTSFYYNVSQLVHHLPVLKRKLAQTSNPI